MKRKLDLDVELQIDGDSKLQMKGIKTQQPAKLEHHDLPPELRNIVCAFLCPGEIFALQQHLWTDLRWDDSKLLEQLRVCAEAELQKINWQTHGTFTQKSFFEWQSMKKITYTLQDFYSNAHASGGWFAGECLLRIAHGLPASPNSDWTVFVPALKGSSLEESLTVYYDCILDAPEYHVNIEKHTRILHVKQHLPGHAKIHIAQCLAYEVNTADLSNLPPLEFDVCKIACSVTSNGLGPMVCCVMDENMQVSKH